MCLTEHEIDLQSEDVFYECGRTTVAIYASKFLILSFYH